MIKICCMRYCQLPNEVLKKIIHKMPLTLQNKWVNKNFETIKQSIFAYLNLSVILKKYHGVSINSLQFTSNGKPYLLDYPQIYFSISHTEEIVVCAISDLPIGIDTEKLQEYNENMARKIFNEDVNNKIIKSIDNNMEFTKQYTILESKLKCLDKQLLNIFDGTFLKYGDEFEINSFKFNNHIISCVTPKLQKIKF